MNIEQRITILEARLRALEAHLATAQPQLPPLTAEAFDAMFSNSGVQAENVQMFAEIKGDLSLLGDLLKTS